MKTYKELREAYGSGSIYWDAPEFDPNNPTVAISGYGTMGLNLLIKNIADDLDDLSKKTKSGQLDVIANNVLLNPKSTFLHKVKAYADAVAELKSTKSKRKLTL